VDNFHPISGDSLDIQDSKDISLSLVRNSITSSKIEISSAIETAGLLPVALGQTYQFQPEVNMFTPFVSTLLIIGCKHVYIESQPHCYEYW
jgi:hypothetical protein